MIRLGSDPAADLVTWPECDLPPQWLLLRFRESGYTLQRGTGSAAEDQSPSFVGECAFGSWIDIQRYRLRVIRAVDDQTRSANADPAGEAEASAGQAGQPSSTLGIHSAWSGPEVQIITADGANLRFTFPGEGCEVIIGRKRKGTDLVIAQDQYISARHLRLFRLGGRPALEDLNSTQGTTLNGTRLTQPTTLTHGDEAHFGQSTIRYVCYRDILGPEGSEPEPELPQDAGVPRGPGRDAGLRPTEEAPEPVPDDRFGTHEQDQPDESVGETLSKEEEGPDIEPPRPQKPPWRLERWGGILLILVVILAFVGLVVLVALQ